MPIARFQMPDGRIARFEVPEGTTPEAAHSLVQQELQNQAINLEAVKPNYTFGEAASKGLTRGAKQISSAFGDVIPAMAASALGYDEYAKRQMDEAAATQKEIQTSYAPEVQSYKDVKDLGSAAKYGVETLTEQIPNLATMLIPGGVGAAVGRRAALGAAEAAGLGEVETAAAVAAKQNLGQNTGIYLGSFAQNTPEVFQNIYDASGGKLEPGAAILAGGLSSVLDSAMPMYLIKKFSGPSKALFVESLLEKSGMEPGLARKAISTLPEAVGLEGLTEGAQEAISIKAEKYINKNQDKFSSDEWNRVLESGIRGAVAGLGLGLPTTVASHLHEGRQASADQIVQDILNQPATTQQPDVTGVIQNGNVRPNAEGNRDTVQVPGQPLRGETTTGPTDVNGPGDIGATTTTGRTETGTEGSTTDAPNTLEAISEAEQLRNQAADIQKELDSKSSLPEIIKQSMRDQIASLQKSAAESEARRLDQVNKEQLTYQTKPKEIAAPQAAINAWNNISRTSFSDLVPEDQAKVVNAHKAGALNNNFADELDQYYEESRQAGVQNTNETAESITNHLVNEFGNNVRTAQNRGTLQIVDDASKLPEGVTVAPNAVGAYHKGTSYIIANRINKDNARSVLLHEVGEHHGLEGMLGKDLYKQVLRQVRNMNNMDATVTDAHDHVNKQYPELKPGTDEHTREVLARIGETAPQNTLWRKVVGGIKNFLTKMGLYNPNKMTTADIHDLILHSTRTTLKRGTQKLPGAKVQEMRAAPGSVNKEDAQNTINSVGKVYRDLPKYTSDIGREVRNYVSRSPGWFQKVYMSFLSLPQKIELYGDKLPALKSLLKALELRASTADKLRSEVDRLVFAGKAIIDRHPRSIVDKWNKITMKLSADGIDPRDPKNINNDLVRNFRTLPKDLQDLAIAYTKQYESYMDKLVETLTKLSPNAGVALRTRFEKNRQPFYHPLRRQGTYWLSYKTKTGEDVVKAFVSPAEREDEVKKATALGATELDKYTRVESRNYKDAPPTGFVSDIINMLQKELEGKGLDTDGIINEIYNSYLDLMPTGSIRQQMRERAGTAGYIEDVVGGFADIGSKIANQLSNIEHRPEIDAAVGGLNENLANYTGEDKEAMTAVVQDVNDQKKFLDNPVANPISANLSFVSYIWNIAGNVSSAIVNMTQVPMTVFPMLAGRYGYGKSFGAMQKAYNMYFKGGRDNNRVYMPDITFGMASNLSPEHKALYEAAIEAAAIRRGPGYELSEMRRKNASDFTGTKAKIETGLSWIFQNTERMNREVTLIAAYDLARANGMSVEQATKEALDLTTKAHSHALSEAGPRIFQDGIGKVAFTFKRFAQAQIYNTARLFHEAFKNEDPATRAIARKQLTGIMGMTYLFSGAQGLPLYGAANMLSSAIAGMFGDDEPFDFDEEVREAIGDLGYKGPMNKLLGVDIASRTGFNGMVWRTDEQRLAEVGFAPYFAEHFFGPAYQVLAINPVRAAKLWDEGHTERALETVLPVFAKNPMKAFRMATEGATNKDGVKVIDDVSVYSAFMQIWGFTNSDLAEAYARANAMKQGEKEILDRKTSLINLHYLAKVNGDDAMLEKVNEDIAKFKQTFPGLINADTLRRSEAQHQVRLKKSIDGVYLNKKTARYVQEELGS